MGTTTRTEIDTLYFCIKGQSSYTLYCMVMEWRFGATVGKMVMGLRVISDGAGKPGPRAVILRNLSRMIFLSYPVAAFLLLVIPLLI